MSTVQRNTLVAPFNVNSPLTTKDSKGKPTSTLEVTHQRWLTQATAVMNASLQLSAEIPASSSASGNPGTMVLYSGGFYLCVGSNTWLQFVGTPF
jgi:hypothetical protein